MIRLLKYVFQFFYRIIQFNQFSLIIRQDESQFVMQEEFSRNALVYFINNYTNGFLRRTMRSSNPKRFENTFKKQKCKENKNNKICVPELSTDTFLSTVLNPDKVCV
jgi:hypothetical protein